MIVFFVPITPRITSMFGRDKDGPANNNANAGPLPMPEASNPWMIGTSVNVAKYMNAPVKLAKKFESKELPPTAHSIQWLGMIPAITVLSCVEPNKNPAITTPIANRGKICFANPQDEKSHSLFSSSRLSKISITDNEVIPTIIGTRGISLISGINMLARRMESTVIITPDITHIDCNFKILMSDQQNNKARIPVIYHL